MGSDEFWQENGGGVWATAVVVVFLIVWQLLWVSSRRRSSASAALKPELPSPNFPAGKPTTGLVNIISDADLRVLIQDLEGKLNEGDTWEEVVYKKNEQLSYKSKCCRPKVGPLKYLSITIFENCSAELLRDFYMDNEYRKEWDKTLVVHEQLQVDETNGTEIGQTIKKFPFLTPREYILAWRVWEGKEKTFYCFIKDCEHSQAPKQKKYVRVDFFRSGWCIRKVPGRDACEITLVHQEDSGLNVEIAKQAFAKGIWSYMCKMNTGLRNYSSFRDSRSTSIVTMLRLIKKVPPSLEAYPETANRDGDSAEASGIGSFEIQASGDIPGKPPRKPSRFWIANGLFVLGGIACLCRGCSALGPQIAMACILKKLMGPKPASRTEAARSAERFRCASRTYKNDKPTL